MSELTFLDKLKFIDIEAHDYIINKINSHSIDKHLYNIRAVDKLLAWSNTPQGSAYWSNINEKVIHFNISKYFNRNGANA